MVELDENGELELEQMLNQDNLGSDSPLKQHY